MKNDEHLKKEIIHIAYRWRSSNSILNNIDKPILNPDLIPIWLFCVEHFFWKANHFCWNLNQYGANDLIKGIKFVSVETYEEVIPLIFE